MADLKISQLGAISILTPATDVLPVVDSGGVTKKITTNQLLGSGGTATLASATITGDLTVDTNVLKVDTTLNRVGVLNASPLYALDVNGDAKVSNALRYFVGATQYGISFANAGVFGIEAYQGTYVQIGTGAGASATERYRIASDGIATWSNVGGVAGTAMTLNATGLGVGKTPTVKLDIGGTGTQVARIQTSTSGDPTLTLEAAGADNCSILYDRTNGGMRFDVSAITGAMRLSTTGNFSIGDTAFAGTRLTLRESASQPNALAMTNRNATQTWRIGVDVSAVDDKILGFYDSTSTTFRMQLTDTGNLGIGVTPSGTIYSSSETRLVVKGTATSYAGTVAVQSKGTTNAVTGFLTAGDNVNEIAIGSVTNSPINFYTNNAYKASLDASGNLLLNTTTVLDAAHLTVACTAASGAKTPLSLKVGVDAAGYVAVSLRNQTAVQGTIVVDVTGARYLTASDYRLKNVLGPISGGLARVNALKPSIYKWKADGSTGEGFIAHELAEVVPAAVNGAKDAVNEDGTINPQNVDMSRIVPILVAAIKELAAEVNALKNA